MAAEFRGLTTLICPPERMHDVLRQLRDDPRLDYNFRRTSSASIT
jgi:hypothetical protein